MKKFISISLVVFAVLAIVTAPVVVEANMSNDVDSEPIEFELGQHDYEWDASDNSGESLVVEYCGGHESCGGDCYIVKTTGWDDQKGRMGYTHWSENSKNSAESYVNDWLNEHYYA